MGFNKAFEDKKFMIFYVRKLRYLLYFIHFMQKKNCKIVLNNHMKHLQ